MSPNLEESLNHCNQYNVESSNVHLSLSPFGDTTSESEASDNDSIGELQEVDLNIVANRNCIPLEHNLRELLVKLTNTENLETLTLLKLRVIAQEATLQYLSIYTPALRELVLDGSVVSSLRDLGCGLKNLKILRVNRCQLKFIDGVFGLESLEELHASDNQIPDVLPCVFLPLIKVIDVARNQIKNSKSLGFLSFCKYLEHLSLQGNDIFPHGFNYREKMKNILPNLKTLDGIPFDRDMENENFTMKNSEPELHKTRSRQSETGFVINFPPRVVPSSISSTPAGTSEDGHR